ncbi:hypothetical protein OCH239_13060 [Roseivivax halodurans JCM 10272]|uniref:Uncharacterized protein n=1 Tax=Roseivivax halodurans JCM 10272 TaxID=1449350 RepID=X7EB25_9RHOB|nr:hypothetical protein [Roseivivax halodurans]ETX13157.1 hypothetical protein OCH239_13060 [Roseivivax halodurans JCM 10272]
MTITRLALAAAATTLAFPAISATQDELREALVGNTFQGDMGGGGYSSYFADDGTYYDTDTSGVYEITEKGVCYPDTDFGCYQAKLDGTVLEWIKDGESAGTGEILEGDALDLSAE